MKKVNELMQECIQDALITINYGPLNFKNFLESSPMERDTFYKFEDCFGSTENASPELKQVHKRMFGDTNY